MNIALHSVDTVLTEESIQYTFVVDADLADVGGGTAVVDY